MKTDKKEKNACVVYEDLMMQVASGVLLSQKQRDFCALHERQCKDCRMESGLAGVMKHNDGDLLEGPAKALDDLARRRRISDAVESAFQGGGYGEMVDEIGSGSSEVSAQTFIEEGRVLSARAATEDSVWGRAGKRKGLMVSAVVAAVSLLVIAGAGVWYLLDKGEDKAQRGGDVVADGGVVVLRSGDVRVDEDLVSIGQKIVVGRRLQVGSGRLGVGLPCGAGVMLSGGSEAFIEHLSDEFTSLRLERGSMLVSVAPRKNRGRFVVRTKAGTVTVTGTVFSVAVEGASVEVAVARGHVEIEEPESAPRRLTRGQASKLRKGGGEVREMTESEKLKALSDARSVEMSSNTELASLSITSKPSGALVLVDDVVLGKTPLEAVTRAGHRRVKVALSGRTVVNEVLSMEPGSTLKRDFELEPEAFLNDKNMIAKSEAGVSDSGNKKEAPGRVDQRGHVAGTQVKKLDKRSKNPKELLNEARRKRTARDWKKTSQIYRDLIRLYSNSREARTATVALGFLLLDHLGKPAEALKQFEKYLGSTKKGILAQEAAYGRVRALRRLGRFSEERKGLEAFIKLYPHAPQRSLVKRRLDEMRTRDAAE